MYFKKNIEMNNKNILLFKIGIILIFVALFIIIIFQRFSFYKEKNKLDEQSLNSIQYVTAYVDGNPSNTIPKKDSEYAVDKIECNNNSQGYWNYKNWELNLKNINKTNTKCKIYFIKQYKEPILNGTDPIISDNLISITIEFDGTVKKADREKLWYSYENKNWANAIILEDETKTYNNGEIIPETNIESYFVWIPRYKYKIFNEGKYTGLTNIENKVQTIEVIFENKNTPVSNGTTVGQYLTHPAFTTFDANGMWVGKFETGYKGAITKEQAQVNVNDSSKLQIKPNVYSWRNINVSNAFTTSYNYERNLESHMMKNTEWGSVAYLQHSKYGSQASVRINNNSKYITGYSAINEPTCGYTAQNDECNRYEGTLLNADGTYTKRYNSDTGVLASTTNNISGIYDMSGGAWEYVMGVMLDIDGKPMSGRNSIKNSGFNGTFGCPTCDSDTSGKTNLTNGINFPNAKYYDQYAYAEVDERYDRRILGDATGEMGPFTTKQHGSVTPQSRQIGSWYADEAWFVYPFNTWFHRSGSYHVGCDTGTFAFGNGYGHVNESYSFRVVMSM